MRVVFAVAKRFLLGMVKVRSNLAYMIFMPLVFTFVFGVLPNMSANAKVPVGVIDHDRTETSSALIEYLQSIPDVKIETLPSGDVTRTLRTARVGFVLSIPGGFQSAVLHRQSPVLTMTPAPNPGGNIQGTMGAEQKLKDEIQVWQAAGEARLLQTGTEAATQGNIQKFSDGTKQSSLMKSQIRTNAVAVRDGVTESILKPGQQAVLGFATMFIMMTIFSITGQILKEKQDGTWARIKVSPAAKWSLMGGYSLGFFLTGWVQFGIMYAGGRWLFGIDIPMNAWMILAVSLYVLAACGIALCVSGLVKTPEQHTGTGSFVAIATSMVGGAYWPTDVEPVWMQHVAWLVPQNWAIDAFRMISMGDTGIAFMWPLFVLTGFAVVFFSAGLVQLRYA